MMMSRICDTTDGSSAAPHEHICCVHCNFCGTILAVGVPLSSMFKIVTVKCGHCNHLLSVNTGASAFTPDLGQTQREILKPSGSTPIIREQTLSNSYSSEDATKFTPNTMVAARDDQPEKRPRLPSVYNRFIKAEIQRIKASNPEIKHKEAFSAAAKNWAHYPHIKFGMMLEKSKQAASDKESADILLNNARMNAGFW